MWHNITMYVLASQLRNLPIVGLQTGQEVGTVMRPLVRADSLDIPALYCKIHGGRPEKRYVILMRDIRQHANDCVIVDSHEDIEEAGEIVRLQQAINNDYDPINKLVVNEDGTRLGRVEDYTLNIGSHRIQKLYVHQPFWRSILFHNLVIDRSQIIDINTKQITVRDASIKQLLPRHKVVPEATK